MWLLDVSVSPPQYLGCLFQKPDLEDEVSAGDGKSTLQSPHEVNQEKAKMFSTPSDFDKMWHSY